MTAAERLAWGQSLLEEAGIAEARIDAWELYTCCTGMSREELLLHRNEPAGAAGQKRYEEGILRRAQHEPLQYIIGSQSFMGLPFFVDESVLIPRADTETLVEEVLREVLGRDVTLGGRGLLRPEVASQGVLRILDLCTGSGCIGLSILAFLEREGLTCELTGTDLSENALVVARKNATALQEAGAYQASRVAFLQGDLFEPVQGRYDILTSNPPYIATAEIESLMSEVRDFEPRMALDGEADGLAFYRRIAREAAAHLKEGGRLYLEIGFDQGEAVSGLLAEAGFTQIAIVEDLGRRPRVVKAVWPKAETEIREDSPCLINWMRF